jgi:hypothetical protein
VGRVERGVGRHEGLALKFLVGFFDQEFGIA